MNLLVETEITCPFCFESFYSMVDTSQGDVDMVEDCTVCCRPMRLVIACQPGEVESVEIEPS